MKGEVSREESHALVLSEWSLSKVEARSGGEVRWFLVNSGLPGGRWVRAFDFKPGDRRLVRSAFFYVEAPGQWLGGWTPWQGATSLPEGLACFLPADSRLLMEVHYHKGEETVREHEPGRDFIKADRLGLYLSGRRPPYQVSDLVIEAPSFELPARSRHRIRAEATVSSDAFAFALRPEMGPAGRSVEVTALRPDGAREVLLWVHDYKAEWQTPYLFRKPVQLPRGTRIRLTAYYENPSGQPDRERCRATLSLFAKR